MNNHYEDIYWNWIWITESYYGNIGIFGCNVNGIFWILFSKDMKKRKNYYQRICTVQMVLLMNMYGNTKKIGDKNIMTNIFITNAPMNKCSFTCTVLFLCRCLFDLCFVKTI